MLRGRPLHRLIFIHLGSEKQDWLSALLINTNFMTWILTQTLMIQPSELKFDAEDHLARTRHKWYTRSYQPYSHHRIYWLMFFFCRGKQLEAGKKLPFFAAGVSCVIHPVSDNRLHFDTLYTLTVTILRLRLI